MGFWKTEPTPTPEPVVTHRDVKHIPTGTVIQNESGEFFWIKGTKKFRIISTRVLDSWNFPRVVPVLDATSNRYKTYGRLGFREGTVIRDITSSALYLISENKKRLITNPDFLTDFGVTDIIVVSTEEAGIHEGGEDV